MHEIYNKRGRRWLPMASFLCLMFLLFSGGSLVSIKTGLALVGFIAMGIGLISSTFGEEMQLVVDYWAHEILPEIHYLIVVLSCMIAAVFLYEIRQIYRIKIERINE